MATRKKNSLSPVTWLRQLRQRLTSRMACFVWGAIFGNAVLIQPINPLNLILEPPENMLSAASREWLQTLRHSIRELSRHATGEALDVLREQMPQITASGATDFAECAQQFPQQRPLQVTDVSTQWATLALCSEAFAVLYSGVTKTPMVVVEKLNRQRLRAAAGLERGEQFYADARVPSRWRAELADYEGSGLDRGHLAAAANQPTPQAMAQSFALSNMVPQDPTHNRKLWAQLEADIRHYVRRAAGNVYVFSGPLHEGPLRTLGRNGVWIPSHLFKLVYDEASQRAWAYVLPNRADAQLSRPISYAQFVERTQWPLLQGLSIRSDGR